jgi:plasmid stabilization system protein ParE
VQAARRIATIVLDALEPLKKFPELGLDFDKRVGRRMIADHTTRMLVIEKKYLVFYVVHEKHLNILKLVGASTDYLNNLDTLFRHFSDI